MSWASFHASCQPDVLNQSATTALLPLFYEKADSPAMIKHTMDILKNVTLLLFLKVNNAILQIKVGSLSKL